MDIWSEIDREIDFLEENPVHFIEIKQFILENLRQNPEACKIRLYRLLEIAESNIYLPMRAWSSVLLACLYLDRSEVDSAMHYVLTASELFEFLENNEGLSFTYNVLMGINNQAGNYEAGIEWCLKGIALAERSNDQIVLSKLYLNLTIAYVSLGHAQEAKDSYDRYEVISNKVSNQTEDTKLIGEQLKAEVFLLLGDAKTARTVIKSNFEISEQFLLHHVESMRILGDIELEIGEVKLAKEWYEKAIVLAEKLEARDFLCCIKNKLACVYSDENIELAVQSFREVIDL
ncbi:MAG: hypothetical protein ACRCWQ_01495, partial [Bacilli bacterium]